MVKCLFLCVGNVSSMNWKSLAERKSNYQLSIINYQLSIVNYFLPFRKPNSVKLHTKFTEFAHQFH